MAKRVKCVQKGYTDSKGKDFYGQVGTVKGYASDDVAVIFDNKDTVVIPKEALRTVRK